MDALNHLFLNLDALYDRQFPGCEIGMHFIRDESDLTTRNF